MKLRFSNSINCVYKTDILVCELFSPQLCCTGGEKERLAPSSIDRPHDTIISELTQFAAYCLKSSLITGERSGASS